MSVIRTLHGRNWQSSLQSGMGSVAVIVMLKFDELRLKISCRPEQRPVEELAPKRANQSFDEGMRERRVRNRLDFRYLKDSKIGLPPMESIQRVMIRAEVFRQLMPADRPMQHATQPGAVNHAPVHAKPNDTPRKLIHHHQHPISTQGGGLAAKQIAAPQAVLGVAEKGEPGGTARIQFRPVMNAQDTANHVLVDFNSKGQGHLLSDARAAPAWIPSFHFQDGYNEFFGRSLRSGSAAALG